MSWTSRKLLCGGRPQGAVHLHQQCCPAHCKSRGCGKSAVRPHSLPLDDLHDFTASVFQLLCEDDDWIGFDHDLHQNIIAHHIFSLCERHHAPVSRSAAVRVDCGADSMAGTGAFCSGQAFCRRPHLTDADHIRVLTKDPLQQEVLVDVQGRIFAGPGLPQS